MSKPKNFVGYNRAIPKTEQCFCKSYADDEGLIQDCTCGKCGTPQAEPTCSYTGHKHSHCDCGEERKKLEAENQRYKRVLEYLLYQSGHKDGNIGEAEMKLIEKTLQPPPPTNDE